MYLVVEYDCMSNVGEQWRLVSNSSSNAMMKLIMMSKSKQQKIECPSSVAS